MDASPDTQTRSPAQKILVALPYTWLAAFFLVPFLIVFKISFSKSAIAVPPYTPLFHLEAGWRGIQDFLAGLSLDNYRLLGSDPLYVLSYVKSLEIAAFSTLLLLVIGFPIAYGIVRMPRRLQAVLVVLVVLPFWVCVDEHSSVRRPAQSSAAGAAYCARTAGLARDRHGDLYRHRLLLPAVHGAAALRSAGAA
jgi:ABC-type sugar transport system permease subunit